MKKIYLAGPDVFYPQALARGQQMRALCAELGFEGIYPLDAQIDVSTAGASQAIFEANRAFIDSADGVVANLRDFRGFEPDSGTVWEVAYALARGKPVVGYLPTSQSLRARMAGHESGGVDQHGCVVEDFGLPLNLMIAHSVTALVFGDEAGFEGLRAALRHLGRVFEAAPAQASAQASAQTAAQA